MPLCDIAFAAGFRSVRRFNDAFRATYGRPPSRHFAPDWNAGGFGQVDEGESSTGGVLSRRGADIILINDPLKPQHAASTIGPGLRSASYSLCSV
jgi:AraC-like DNA-binding protein